MPKAVGERMLALVRPQPSSQRLVRRAWRSAQRLGTDLDLLWVEAAGRADRARGERQLTALRQLASVLGATLLIEEHDDVVDGDGRGRPRARHHLHHRRRVAARGAAWRACASRCLSG